MAKPTLSQYAVVVFYVVVWYIGNILYLKYNKDAAKAFAVQPMICPKGKKCPPTAMVPNGHPDTSAWGMSVATGQLLVGVLYALYLWIAPDTRPMPKITLADVKKMAPTGICSALAHASSVFALSVGGVVFGTIVKAAEPVFSAIISAVVYKHPPSIYKFLCFIPIVGGIAIAVLEFPNFVITNPATWTPRIDNNFFSFWSLIYACAANVFAAFKGLEGKKVKDDKELKAKLGNEANSFAVFGVISLLVSIPLMIFKEGGNPGGFGSLYKIVAQPDGKALTSLLLSGITFYLYNECAFMTLKSDANPAGMDAVTNSVANTAKRVAAIYFGALFDNLPLTKEKIVGSAVCISGVFLYSIIDDLVAKYGKKDKKA